MSGISISIGALRAIVKESKEHSYIYDYVFDWGNTEELSEESIAEAKRYELHEADGVMDGNPSATHNDSGVYTVVVVKDKETGKFYGAQGAHPSWDDEPMFYGKNDEQFWLESYELVEKTIKVWQPA